MRRDRDGFSVCDTGNHRVLFLNSELEITEEISLGYEWIQDAQVSLDGSFLWVLDCNNTRIVKVDLATQKEIISYKYNPDYRGFQIYPVKSRNWLISHL